MLAFRHRDFRLLWSGAFLSFLGSQIQTIAQGWLVYDLTHDAAKLALVTFCSSAPVALFGPAAGALADIVNKRLALVLCQIVFAVGALFLAYAAYSKNIRYEQILIVATINGFASAVEMPTRQSTLSHVVPASELSVAVPLQAMTFNLSRLLGPAIGGALLAVFGPGLCYLVNGISFLALIFAVLAIRADLSPEKREPQPITDLLTEGMLYTLREPRLKTLFFMEAAVAFFGLPYLALMPAIARDSLGLGRFGFGVAMTMIGVGAVSALLLMANLRNVAARPFVIRIAMFVLGFGVLALGFARSAFVAFPILAIIGLAAVAQFNSTNTLFQLLAPSRLRGRVLAMHIWALSGLNPIGSLAFGWLASQTNLQLALQIGGVCVLFCALWGWTKRGVFAASDDYSGTLTLDPAASSMGSA